jgi:hypothetical protein
MILKHADTCLLAQQGVLQGAIIIVSLLFFFLSLLFFFFSPAGAARSLARCVRRASQHA